MRNHLLLFFGVFFSTLLRPVSVDRLLKPQRHIPALDGIRGIAILGTVAIHILYLRAIPAAPPRYLSLFHVAQFGWMGVDLFLVLSGFLITGILLDTRQSANFFRAFYARRTLRIFPLYYGVLLLLLLLSPLLRHTWWAFLLPAQQALPLFFLYLQNWVSPIHHGFYLGVLGPLWTLAIEEQFYLVWPLLVYLLPRRAFALTSVAICVLVPLWRCYLLIHGASTVFVMMNTLTRVDTLAWGALAAVLVRSPEVFARLRGLLPWVASACAAAILIIDFPLHELYARSRYTESIGFTVIAVGSMSVLLLAYISDAKRGQFAKWLDRGWLRSLGRYSYGMYVLQAFVLLPAEHFLPRFSWFGKSPLTGFPVWIVLFLACWAVAACSFHLYERRFLHFKKYFVPDHRDPSTRPA